MRWARNLLLSATLFLPVLLHAQGTGRITGVVVDSGSGQPVASATVTVVGTALGNVTDTEGRYSIGGVPAGTQEVRVQRIGFRPRSASVAVAEGQTLALNFQLLTQMVQLEAVVAVGYGNQLRRDLTGAVSTVTTEALERAPISTIDQVLQGTSPGVQVTSSSGEPGAALSIRIRGTSSITGNSEPLYVIDGFPVENDIEGSSVGNGGRTRTTPPNPLVTLNPNDIESISILKDASSTAIYGARGANGVVIITTRQGRGTRPQFTADFYTGVQEVSKTYEMLSAAEYIDYANQFGANSSTPYVAFTPAEKDSILAAGTNTDWQEEIFRAGRVNNFQAAVRGATSTASPTRYSLSGGLFNQEGIVVGSGLRRLSGRLNLNQSIGSRFEFGAALSANQARSKSIPSSGQQNANAGAISAAIQYVPILPVRRANGTYSYINSDLNAFEPLLDAPQTPNPVSLVQEVADSLSDTRLLTNVFGQAELIEGLDFKVTFGADYADRWRYTYYPRTTLRGQQSNGEALRASAATSSWINENTLTFQREFGTAHRLNVVGGYSRQKTDVDGENLSASDFVSDITGYNDIGAGRVQGIPGSRRTSQALESWISRANYALLDRYIFTATYRADGSSRFAPGKKWGAFPSGAVAWRVSDEPWVTGRYSWLDELKLRASYGLVGNPSIRPYQSLARLNDQGYSFGGQPYAGYYVTAVGNESLTWETTRGTDVGFDLELFDRVAITADYYKKRTSNLLLQVQLELESGFETALANRGKVDNAGFELGIDARILENVRGFGWRANLNYATNRNRVVDLGGPQEIEADLITQDYNLPGTKIRVGHPIGVFYGFRSLGVIPDAAAASRVDWTNFNNNAFTEGDMLIADIDGDKRITLDDRTIIGDPTPKFTLGLTNTLTFRDFELTGLLQGSFGGDILNVNRIRTESSPRVNVARERVRDAWTPTNRNAKFPAVGENPNQVGPNDFTSNLLEDGSYIRLQTITLSWKVPERYVSYARGLGARLYVTGTNVFTITDYSGYNPDVSGQSVGNTNRGIDIGAYPVSRGVTFGLNFNY